MTDLNDRSAHVAVFTPFPVRYVRLVALSAAGGDPHATAAEINLTGDPAP